MMNGPLHSDYGRHGARTRRLPREGYVAASNFAVCHGREGFEDTFDEGVCEVDIHE